jgi:hypothetical protein
VEWQPACDKDGNLLPGGEGWMVSGSRVNHPETSPPLIEIQVYHFSAAQGGFVVVNSENDRDHDHSNHSGTMVVAKCFIDTAIDNPKPAFDLLTLLWLIGVLGVLPAVIALQLFRRKLLLSGPVF